MNKTINVFFAKPVPSCFVADFSKKIFFIHHDISDFDLIIENENAMGVKLQMAEGSADEAELKKMFDDIIEKDILKMRNIKPDIIFKNNPETAYTDAYSALKEKGVFHEMGDGLVATGKIFIDLINYIDGLLMKKFRELFDVKEYRYPTLIKTESLEKCEYFESFPNLIMFVTRLHNNTGNYNDFKEYYKNTKKIDENVLKNHCCNADYCLPPTMCYHTYTQYQNTQFESDVKLTVTSRGKSFRHESKYAQSLERLWDFTIREIVFLGSTDYVRDCRKKLIEAVGGLIKELGLNAYIETANDPFFMDETAGNKSIFQKGLKSKYELRAGINKDETIAIGSFNYHDDFFGSRFKMTFKDSGLPVRTACAGFGLERFAFAYLCQRFDDVMKNGLKG